MEVLDPEDIDHNYYTFELDPKKPLVLLLGTTGGEGSLNLLSTSNRQYKRKDLRSSIDNWKLITQYFVDFQINSVVVRITEGFIFNFADEDYRKARDALFKKIANTPNIVFIYEPLLRKLRNTDYKKYSFNIDPRTAQEILLSFEQLGVDLTPYSKTAELNVLAESFLLDTEKNLIFRMYVPNGRIWSEETDRLLQLFKDYLGRVAKVATRLDQRRTDQGVIYEFHGEDPQPGADLKSDFEDFSKLMDLCTTDTAAAESILNKKDIDHREVLAILTKYSKEARRLQTDLKHEHERKTLSVRQRLESELVDLTIETKEALDIDRLIQSAIPSIYSTYIPLASILAPHTEQPRLSGATINIRPQIINTINAVIAHEIYGDQHLSTEDQKIIELINQHAGNKSTELISAVHELSDKGVPKSERLGAKQKIKNFLFEVGKRTTDVAVGVLQTYIERQIGL